MNQSDISSVGGRIAHIRGAMGRPQFAESLKISVSALRRYELNERSPDIEFVMSMNAIYATSPLWLITGEGPKRRSREAIDNLLGIKSSPDSEFVYIKYFNVAVSAGSGALFDEGNMPYQLIGFRKDYLASRNLSNKTLVAVSSTGDSMEPVISEGNTLLIDLEQTSIKDGCIYVLRVDDHLYAKRLQVEFDGTVRIISENDAYRDQVVHHDKRNELHVIGRVVWSDRDW